MLFYQRTIFSDNSVEADWSVTLNDYRSGSKVMAYVKDEDYLYVASDLPFNHKWFEVATANDEASLVSVENWFGNEWVSCVDVIDSTATSGKSLATSGIIRWTTNRLKGWDRELDSEDVTGVSTTGIYNMYWVRFKWSATLKNTTTLSYIGNKFSSDNVLYSYYPDLNNTNLKSAFATGKTTWDEQHFMASEIIVRELMRRGIITSPSQLLDYNKFETASVHKVAEMIYWGLGRDYDEQRKLARGYFDESFNMKFFNVDLNADANTSDYEKRSSTGYFTR